MKLSTRSRYGTRIVLELARHYGGSPTQVSEIARVQQIPVKYLEQLIRTLKQADLITSVRGSKGGHHLNEKPERITVGQIVRLFEGQTDLVGCVSAPDTCQRAEDCRVREVWIEATEAMYEKLDAITIADLLCEPVPPGK
ncbi:MAG: Rrf2 family transcriptional regulator [Desulfobacteraceae bacterium]|jgi:Rrf2 family transcriptional regulator, iron-sulfur cluster assembly transcription factor